MLLLLLGLNKANSHYACVWCNIHFKDRYVKQIKQSYIDMLVMYYRHNMTKVLGRDYQKRTLDALLSDNRSDPRGKQLRLGQIDKPLLHIELDHVVPDELHLMLRITDVLTRNVIHAAMSEDVKLTHIDKLQRPKILSLMKEIRSCGVSFHIWMSKSEEGGFTFTSLVGNDKLKLLKQLPAKFSNCQPKTYYKTVKEIWEVCILFISSQFNQFYAEILWTV